MKKDIHPECFIMEVSCSCGNTFEVNSCKTATATATAIEVCWKCHPAYTGKQKAQSTQGRSDKFRARFGMKK